MNTFLPAMLLMVAVSPAVAQTPTPPPHDASAQDVYLNTQGPQVGQARPGVGSRFT
jgi:hypothetical protein